MGAAPLTDSERGIPVDIKISFTQSPRELVISTQETQDAVTSKVKAALASEEGILELEDTNGSKFVINVGQIAHVEVGTTTPRTVGFAGA
ncbi:hypothetical protein COCCU_03495 [Corynebacterium occultum]|uniref:ATP-binding protein n=1 Tax=Corynebacterium occultum TaxID=2675219 RepID=A0A6B8VRB6_9CORY|nr:hypothetical protein COCCU_03495 [Corynebacterium occultum]